MYVIVELKIDAELKARRWHFEKAVSPVSVAEHPRAMAVAGGSVAFLEDGLLLGL